MNPQGIVQSWNPAAESLFGWSEAEAVGRTIQDLTGADPAEFRTRAAVVVAGGNIVAEHSQRYHKSGKLIDVSFTTSPLTDSTGKVVAGLVFYSDITANRKMAEAIRVSEARLALALEESNVGLWDWDVITGETYYSDTWFTLLGYEPGELPQQQATFQLLAHPDDVSVVLQRWNAHVTGEIPKFDVQLRMRHKDGHWVWVQTSGRVVQREADGRARRAIGTHTDVSAYRRSEAELRESTDRLRAVLDASPLATFVCSLDRVVLRWSPAAERAFGWTAEQVLGRVLPIIPEASLDDWQRHAIAPAQAGKSVTSFRTRHVHRDGFAVDVMVSAGALHDADGTVDSILVILSDEAERLASERTILEQGQFLRNVLDINPSLIFAKDRLGRYTLVNQAFAEACGTSIEQIIGRRDIDFVSDSGLLSHFANDSSSAGANSFSSTEWVRDASGRKRLLQTVKRPLLDADGQCRQLLGVATDITEQDTGRRELQLARDAAERDRRLAEESREIAMSASEAKSRFLANMSHEIRTPMTAILGFADLMANPAQNVVERAECVQTIRRNGHHLLGLINDVLDFSKIEAGKMSIERLPCSPCRMVGDVVSLMRLRAAEAGLPIDVTFTGVIPQNIESDAMRVRQVLMNLLSNAIKFTNAGSVRVDLQCRGGLSDSALVAISVTDTGLGMTELEIKKLFQPFIQADVSTTRKFGGTGLGLAICKRLAVMLGGDLTVASVAGVGSTFTLTLDPGNLSRAKPVLDPERATFAPATIPTLAVEDRPLNGRVLLAEDGHDNQRLISHLLQHRGLVVDVVDNGQSVLDRIDLDHDTFDLILMDMQMPIMDGYAATMALRDRGYKKPIVAVTAHASVDDRRLCLAAGCSDFMNKPIDPAAFARMLDAHFCVKVDQVAPIKSRYQEEKVMRDLIQAYVDGLPAMVDSLGQCLEAGDLGKLRQSTHQLKGSGGGYGFDAITEQAASAEACIKAGAALDTIRTEVQALIDVLMRIDGFRAIPQKEACEAT